LVAARVAPHADAGVTPVLLTPTPPGDPPAPDLISTDMAARY
jgi:hypothetical protein